MFNKSHGGNKTSHKDIIIALLIVSYYIFGGGNIRPIK